MLMSFSELNRVYNFQATGILHLGAHTAEEAPLYYEEFGDIPVWWVEANPRVIPVINRTLKKYQNQQVIQALIYSADGEEKQFNVTNLNGLSSSLLEFGTHEQFSPDIRFVERIMLPTRTVDSLVSEHGVEANFLNMDLQGAELIALSGATDFIQGVDYILTEINKHEVYVGCAKAKQLDRFLSEFKRVETFWVGDQGWGDALYVRRSINVCYN